MNVFPTSNQESSREGIQYSCGIDLENFNSNLTSGIWQLSAISVGLYMCKDVLKIKDVSFVLHVIRHFILFFETVVSKPRFQSNSLTSL